MFVDVAPFLEGKLSALGCHASQVAIRDSDGRVADIWMIADEVGLLHQLGARLG